MEISMYMDEQGEVSMRSEAKSAIARTGRRGRSPLRSKRGGGRKCGICGKTTQIGYNRPKSLHRTKRRIRPNLQKIANQLICIRCLRTQSKFSKRIYDP